MAELTTFTDRQKMEAAYALNLCTVSLTQIMDYSDPYILEQEYDAILNNLNIQNIIHDESMLTLIKKILEALTFYRIQEGDKKFLDQEYQGKMKSAIWSAVPSLSVILAGGNPITAAVAIASQVGIGYMNYRKEKANIDFENEKKEWELKRSLIDEISVLQRQLFETAWRLSDRYDFDDSLRLTEKQIKQYSAILMDGDPLRRYERLDTQKEIFEAFPPFWYYKGNAAKEISHKYANNKKIAAKYAAKALEDYRKFGSVYVELMREDVVAASCAIEHIALLDKSKDADEIKKLLDRVMHFAGDNFDVLQIAALNYISLEETDKAKLILRRLVNENYNIGLNGLLLSRIYCKIDKDKAEYEILQDRIGSRNVIPWIEDDSAADKKYIEDNEERLFGYFTKFIDTFGVKYQNQFSTALGFDKTSRLRKQVDWCINTDMTQILIDKSNELFAELLANEVFSLQKRADNQSWKDFFVGHSAGVSEKIKAFNAVQIKIQTAAAEIMATNPFGFFDNVANIASKVKENADKAYGDINQKTGGKLDMLKSGVKFIGELSPVGAIGNLAGKAIGENVKLAGNTAEQEKLKSVIKVLLQSCDMVKVMSEFFDAIKKEFKKNLTVESVVSLQENMLLIINNWYLQNGFRFSAESGNDSLVTDKEDQVFFVYP
jgi:hypothetical protein